MSATEKEVAASAGESYRVDLPITGMTCAACARRIERRLSKTPGVSAANVNFATQRATVEYDPRRTNVRQLAGAVEEIGYGVIDVTGGDERATVSREEEARRAERRDLARRFAVAAVLSLPVPVISLGNVTVESFDGGGGWPAHAPYDVIIVSAGAPRVQPLLAAELAEGGRLVIPLGGTEEQTLALVRRTGGAVRSTNRRR